MRISASKTETIETEVEYDIDVSKLGKDEIDELFNELIPLVSQNCIDDLLDRQDFLMAVIEAGHPYIGNKTVVRIAEFLDTELDKKEHEKIYRYLKSNYPVMIYQFTLNQNNCLTSCPLKGLWRNFLICL